MAIAEVGIMRAGLQTQRATSATLLTIACLAVVGSANAQQSSSALAAEPSAERHLAAGLRVGLIPPVFTVAELLGRPVPHLALGVFGAAVPQRFSAGGELMFEANGLEDSTTYAQASFLYYSDSRAHWERSQVVYLTAGYIWKFESGFEAQLGGGALFILSDETKPCTEFCFQFVQPTVLPTFDLALRYRFL